MNSFNILKKGVSTMKKVMIIFIAVTWMFTGCSLKGPAPSENREAPSGETRAPDQGPKGKAAVYVADKGEILTAYFDNIDYTVVIKLAGRKEIKLPRAISASGARYSNGRETFWEHHGEGSYWIGEELIFRGRVKEDNLK
jgi:membrane-bound inhibitor of C-type lysozyme